MICYSIDSTNICYHRVQLHSIEQRHLWGRRSLEEIPVMWKKLKWTKKQYLKQNSSISLHARVSSSMLSTTLKKHRDFGLMLLYVIQVVEIRNSSLIIFRIHVHSLLHWLIIWYVWSVQWIVLKWRTNPSN